MWTVEFKNNTNNEKIGTVSATWVNPSDDTDTFTYSEERAELATAKAMDGFTTRAKEALASRNTKYTKVRSIKTSLEAKLNA